MVEGGEESGGRGGEWREGGEESGGRGGEGRKGRSEGGKSKSGTEGAKREKIERIGGGSMERGR